MGMGGIIGSALAGAFGGVGDAMAEQGRDQMKGESEANLARLKSQLDQNKELALQKARDDAAMQRTQAEQQGATQRNDSTNTTHVTTTKMTNDTSKAVAETQANAQVFAGAGHDQATRDAAGIHAEASRYGSDKAAETRMSQEDKAILMTVMDDAKQALAQKQAVTTAMEKELQNAVSESQKKKIKDDYASQLTQASVALNKANARKSKLFQKYDIDDEEDAPAAAPAPAPTSTSSNMAAQNRPPIGTFQLK